MSATIIQAIDRALKLNVPFAAWSLPGSAAVGFIANPSYTDGNGLPGATGQVTVSEFGRDAATSAIAPEMNADEFLRKADNGEIPALPAGYHIRAAEKSTARIIHTAQTIRLVDRLRHSAPGSKTVLSRRIIGRNLTGSWTATLNRVFAGNPDLSTFRFAFFTPDTGAWIGLSPELLLRQTPDGIVTSMALAGSRKAATGGPWDTKNVEEHRPVVNYILDRFRSEGLTPKASEATTVVHGAVEHLRHIIAARNATIDTFDRLLRALNPTPALAGWPVDDAIREITATELHPRGAYGGYIAVTEPDGTRSAYVNLRSMRVDGDRFCVYVGGGITARSNPADEWAETEAKSRQIMAMIPSYELLGDTELPAMDEAGAATDENSTPEPPQAR